MIPYITKTVYFTTLLMGTISLLTISAFADPVRYDSTRVERRFIAAERLAGFRSNSDFRYSSETRPAVSLLQQLEYWIWETLLRTLMSREYYHLRMILLYLFIAAVGGYAIYRMRGAGYQGAFSRSGSGMIDFQTHPDLLEALDLPRLIAEAESRGQYRLAIRWQFLKMLQDLERRGLIRWHPRKTNREYRAEMSVGGLGAAFAGIAEVFEHAWYGQYDVTEVDYRRLMRASRDLSRKLPVMEGLG